MIDNGIFVKMIDLICNQGNNVTILWEERDNMWLVVSIGRMVVNTWYHVIDYTPVKRNVNNTATWKSDGFNVSREWEKELR